MRNAGKVCIARASPARSTPEHSRHFLIGMMAGWVPLRSHSRAFSASPGFQHADILRSAAAPQLLPGIGDSHRRQAGTYALDFFAPHWELICQHCFRSGCGRGGERIPVRHCACLMVQNARNVGALSGLAFHLRSNPHAVGSDSVTDAHPRPVPWQTTLGGEKRARRSFFRLPLDIPMPLSRTSTQTWLSRVISCGSRYPPVFDGMDCV